MNSEVAGAEPCTLARASSASLDAVQSGLADLEKDRAGAAPRFEVTSAIAAERTTPSSIPATLANWYSTSSSGTRTRTCAKSLEKEMQGVVAAP